MFQSLLYRPQGVQLDLCFNLARKRSKAVVNSADRNLITFSWNVRCPWKNASWDGLSNATFFQRVICWYPLGVSTSKVQRTLQRPGASSTTRVRAMKVCGMHPRNPEYTAQAAGGGVLLGGLWWCGRSTFLSRIQIPHRVLWTIGMGEMAWGSLPEPLGPPLCPGCL